MNDFVMKKDTNNLSQRQENLDINLKNSESQYEQMKEVVDIDFQMPIPSPIL